MDMSKTQPHQIARTLGLKNAMIDQIDSEPLLVILQALDVFGYSKSVLLEKRLSDYIDSEVAAGSRSGIIPA